jgi:hypothetical protein
MKRFLPLGLILVFVFSFTFVMAFEDPGILPGGDPLLGGGGKCCTYTNWCGGVGYGSTVPYTCYDQLGKPHTCYHCYCWLPSGSEYYNFKCNYQCAPNCNAE